jgi:hypothetical protein
MSKRLFACFLLLASVSVPAVAQEGVDPVLESVMKSEGVSAAEAQRRLTLLEEANRIGNRMEAEEPVRYAGIRVQQGRDFAIFVRIVGEGESILKRYTSDPAFRVEKADTPLRALRNKQQALINAMDSKTEFAVSVDVAVGKVRVIVLDAAALKGRLQSSGLLASDVIVEEVPDVVTPAVTIIGGHHVRGKSWAVTGGGTIAATATLGFNIVHVPSNVRGVLTAGHFDECKFSVAVTTCTRNSPATDVNTGATLDFQAQRLGGDYDYEWRTSGGNSFTNQIYYGANMAVTQVYDVEAYQPNTLTLCKYGNATGYTCGLVENPREYVSDPTYGIAGYFARVKRNTTGLMADSGDSGGPVFGSATAFGIVQGKVSSGTYAGHMVFMPIKRIGPDLRVLTTP